MAKYAYKIYAYSGGGGPPSLDVLPNTNTPYGESEVNDAKSLASLGKQFLDYYKNWMSQGQARGDTNLYDRSLAAYNQYGGDQAYQRFANIIDNPKAVTSEDYNLFKGMFPSLGTFDQSQFVNYLGGQTIDSNKYSDPNKPGTPLDQSPEQHDAEIAAHEAAVKAGTEKKVPIGSGFGYIPTGSAGDLLMSGKQSPSQPGSSDSGSGGLAAPNLKEYHVGGTYYGYDDKTGYLVAFSDMNQLKQYFPNGIDKNAPALPQGVDPSVANKTPGSIIHLETGTPIANLTGGSTATGTGTGSKDLTSTPAGVQFSNSEAYKRLTPEQQQVANTIFNVFSTGTEQQAGLMVDAIQKAQANSDPYYKSVLDLTLGEIGAHVAQINGDFETSAKIINKTQKDLLENVNSQKDFLSLSEQSDLAKLAQQYGQEVLKTKDNAAETGTTFGTGYKSADYNLGQLEQSNNNIVTSTQTQYNYQIKSLQAKADQGDENAKLQLEQLTNKKTADLQNLGNSAEGQVGSGNVNVSGYTPVGGVLGTIEENHKKDILAGISNYFSLNQPTL